MYSKYLLMVFFMCLFIGVTSVASATEKSDKGTVVAHVTVRNHDVIVYKIGEVEAPNTDKGVDGFAIDVAYWLHEWTKEHGVEAIGNLCHTPDGKRWGTILLTIYAHTTSPRTELCPDGMVLSGSDIHSHPQRHTYPVNFVDQLFLHNGLMTESKIATEPDVFSPEDYQDPDDYLVGQFKLHHEHGFGTSTVVWNMHDPKPN